MFERAYKEGYAIGAFNVNNMEIIQGIMEAGTEEKAPLILQVSAGARKYAGQNYIVKLIEAGLLEADLPVVLHLDHGADFDICKACVDGGFTSVMIDGSHHSFEDNIAVTKRVVEYAHAHGGVVDLLSTSVMSGNMLKVLIWYDNEAGFTNQLLRLITMVGGKM